MSGSIEHQHADKERAPDAEVPHLLDGYMSEQEYARQRGITPRTAQRHRQLGVSPPFIVLGKQVYYRIESVRQWLRAREQGPVAARPSGKMLPADRY